MTIRELFALMPNGTQISIFDRNKCDTVYEGDILHCTVQKEKEIIWLRLGTNQLFIDVE